MSAQVLPPQSRDFEIYRQVQVLEVSQRQVAREMKLSATRIRQIIARVGGFLAAMPVVQNELTLEQQLKVAGYVASERVEHLYGEALRAWEASLKNRESVRRIDKDGSVTLIETTQSPLPRVACLNSAFRFAIASEKRVGASIRLLADIEEEVASGQEEVEVLLVGGAEVGGEPERWAGVREANLSHPTMDVEVVASVEPVVEVVAPPVRDCAVNAEREAKKKAGMAVIQAVKSSNYKVYRDLKNGGRSRKARPTSPAQSAETKHHRFRRLGRPDLPYFAGSSRQRVPVAA